MILEPKKINRLTVNGVPLREIPYADFVVFGDHPLMKGWDFVPKYNYHATTKARLYKALVFNGRYYSPDINSEQKVEADTQKLHNILDVAGGKPWWWFVSVGRIKQILFKK